MCVHAANPLVEQGMVIGPQEVDQDGVKAFAVALGGVEGRVFEEGEDEDVDDAKRLTAEVAAVGEQVDEPAGPEPGAGAERVGVGRLRAVEDVGRTLPDPVEPVDRDQCGRPSG